MSRRGFTLIELMIVLSIVGVITAAGGMFYLQGRQSAARIETQVRLQRDASLAAEIIARDVRGASAVDAEGAGLLIKPSAGGAEIKYRVEGRTMSRDDWVISRFVERVRVEPIGDVPAWRVTVELAHELGAGPKITATREVIARRITR